MINCKSNWLTCLLGLPAFLAEGVGRLATFFLGIAPRGAGGLGPVCMQPCQPGPARSAQTE